MKKIMKNNFAKLRHTRLSFNWNSNINSVNKYDLINNDNFQNLLKDNKPDMLNKSPDILMRIKKAYKFQKKGLFPAITHE